MCVRARVYIYIYVCVYIKVPGESKLFWRIHVQEFPDTDYFT